MAKKKADDGAAGKGGKEKGGMKKLAVPAVALLLGVFVGPKFLGGGGNAEAGAATTTTTAPGPVISLEPITLNLSDGHLLKVGLALQISADWLEEHGEPAAEEGHGAADTDDPTQGYARALDAAITVFSAQTMPGLTDAAGREQARAALNQALQDAYHGEIEGVYLYQFVMQ
jgi:flagellar FliL protein